MVDRKTVIKGVGCCSRPNNTNLCGECPYNKSETRFGCMHRLITDVFAILKEQEAVVPNVSSTEQRCGNCNKIIEMDGWITCPWCGKSIAWNEWWNKNGGQAVK